MVKKSDSFNKLKIFRRKIRISGEPLKGELFQAKNDIKFQVFDYTNYLSAEERKSFCEYRGTLCLQKRSRLVVAS